MNHPPLRDGLRLLARAAAPGAAGVSDVALLDRFARHRDEAAFELLVWRHGAMVLGTCRRLLRDAHEAEDAAQACFLVLARRAGAVGRRGAVGGWLHRVAYRVALRARAGQARRDARRRPLDDRTPAGTPDPVAAAGWREVRRVLDDEVNRLPDRFRVPFVLCCLEGRAAADAARDLGCPVGTIESRLTRARARLRVALGRRGVTLSAGLLAALPAADVLATLPAELASTTAKAALAGTGRAAVVSANVTALTEGVIQAMWLAKFKAAAALVLAAAVLGTGSGILWHQPATADPAAPTPPPKAPAEPDRVAGLVQRLGGAAFADRERAARELEALGAPALPALREAARGDDPERKKRADELVRRIEARAAAAKVLAAKRVRLKYQDTPLAEAVADFKARSGYDVALADAAGALKDRRVTLDTGDVTFWRAVEQFCQAAGLEEAPPPAPRPGGGGAAVRRGGGGAVVGGGQVSPFAPPGRVTLTDGKWARRPTDDRTAVRVRAVGRGDAAPAADGEIVLHLEIAPEPRLRWQRTVGVDAGTATDDRGQALEQVRAADPAPAPPAGVGPGRAVAGGGFGGGPGDPAGVARPVSVRLKAGARPSGTLKELSGTVALQVLADPEDYVTVDGILDAAGKTVKAADGGAVRVIGVTKEAGGRTAVKFGIDPPAGGPAGGMFHMSMRGGRVVLTGGPGSAVEHEVALVDAKGAALPLVSAGVQVAGAGAEFTLVCQPAAGQAPAKLACTVSRSVTLDVPFTLRDVPLP